MRKYKIEYDKGKARLLALRGFGLSAGIYIGNVLQALLFFGLYIGLIILWVVALGYNRAGYALICLIAFIVVKICECIMINKNMSKDEE